MLKQACINFVYFVLAIGLISQPLNADDKRTLKLALVTSLSGAAAIHGQSLKNGVELALEELRAEGWKTELAVEDDQTNPGMAVSAVSKLASQGHSLFVGPTWSYLAESVAPVYARLGVVAIGPAVSSEVVGTSSDRFFFGMSKSEGKIAPLAEWMSREGVKKVVILYANSRWGLVHEEVFKKAAAKANVQVIGTETFEYGQETALPSLLVRLNRLKPDAYLTTSSKEGVVEINKKLLELKAQTRLVSTEDLQDAARMGILPAASRGVSRWALTYRSSDDFMRRYKEKFHENPYVFADTAYDSAKLFALAKANSEGTPESIAAYLRNVDYNGASGRWQFDENRDVAKGTYELIGIDSAG